MLNNSFFAVPICAVVFSLSCAISGQAIAVTAASVAEGANPFDRTSATTNSARYAQRGGGARAGGRARSGGGARPSGGNVNANVLAGGIWEALMTTATGLAVGIVAYLFYNFFIHHI